MKKFFATLLVTLILVCGAVAEQRDTTSEYDATVSSKTTVYDTAGNILGYRMEMQSGSHQFYGGCLVEYRDCYALNPGTGVFTFHYMDNDAISAYPLNGTQALGSIRVITGDGTVVVLFYWDR